MENQNIGQWTAKIKNDSKRPTVIIEGTFPVRNGEKPKFHLKRMNDGFAPNQMIFQLAFGELVDTEGTSQASLVPEHSEPVDSADKYDSVLVQDKNSRTIATIKITH